MGEWSDWCEMREYNTPQARAQRRHRAEIEQLEQRIEQLQRHLAEAVANEREACAKVMDERAAMYRGKAQRHADDFDQIHTTYERFVSNADASEYGAAAIRERTD